MKRSSMVCLQAFAVLALTGASLRLSAQSSGGPYTVTHSVITGGGTPLNGGTFRLVGTLGQPATATLNATDFRLSDGFWTPASTTPDLIFANGFDP